MLVTDEDEPLTSGIAHIIVKDDAGNEAVAYMQKATEYPEAPVYIFFHLKMIKI